VKRSKRSVDAILVEAEEARKKPTKKASGFTSYLNFLKLERGLSKNSLEAYTNDLRKLEEFLAAQKRDIVHASKSDLQLFIRSLSEVGLERSSITRTVSSLRGFYRYLLTERLILSDPTETLEVKTPRRKLPDVLSIAEVTAMLDGPDLSTEKGVRDKAILEFLYACGARVSEATTLKLTQLFLDDGLVKLFGKGSKERVVPVGRYAREAVYLCCWYAIIYATLVLPVLGMGDDR